MGRNRNNAVLLYLSDKELNMLDSRVAESNAKNRSDYIRKGLINGGAVYIVDTKTLFKRLKDVASEINKIGININQIAVRVNSTNNLYVKDLQSLQETIHSINQLVKRTMHAVVKLDNVI